MAQNIVKSIRSDRPTRQPKTGLDQLPEVKRTDRQPKKFEAVKEEEKRKRFGHLSVGYSPNRRPKQEENGAKIK